MSDPVESYVDIHGNTVEVRFDEDPPDPREDDNLTTMACFHGRYCLGDSDHGIDHRDYSGWDGMEADIIKRFKPICIAPLYLYEHSGLRIKIGSFQGLLPQGHAEFDSGQVGFVWVTRKRCRELMGCKKVTAAVRWKVERDMREEVETYDDYLSGNCWGYVVKDKDGEEMDSCWGYLGDTDACLEDARAQYPERKTR